MVDQTGTTRSCFTEVRGFRFVFIVASLAFDKHEDVNLMINSLYFAIDKDEVLQALPQCDNELKCPMTRTSSANFRCDDAKQTTNLTQISCCLSNIHHSLFHLPYLIFIANWCETIARAQVIMTRGRCKRCAPSVCFDSNPLAILPTQRLSKFEQDWLAGARNF
jgi:hypothetical protein